jgi:large subunit ribosomal protein L9
MKVILIENVPSLGKSGDTVQVAEGYGRNFLIPKKMALQATPANLRRLEQQREVFLQKGAKEKQSAFDLAARIDELSCTLAHPAGENEKLFGSVTSMDLQRFLQEKGISLDRRKILLPQPIKTLGSYSVPLKLHPEITAQLKVNVVAASPEEKEKP